MRAGSYLVPTILAVLLHGVVIVLLAQSWFEHHEEVRKTPRHVQAQVVDLKSQAARKKAETEAKAKSVRASSVSRMSRKNVKPSKSVNRR